jgi:hypothetical protein
MKSGNDLNGGELKIKIFPVPQNQALNALVFFCKKVLKQTLDQKIDALRAKTRVP